MNLRLFGFLCFCAFPGERTFQNRSQGLWACTLDTPLGEVPVHYMEKHVKQTFQMDTYYHKLNHEFRKSHAISQMIGGHFEKCDIYIIFINSINEKLVATENRLNLEL